MYHEVQKWKRTATLWKEVAQELDKLGWGRTPEGLELTESIAEEFLKEAAPERWARVESVE